MPFRRGPGAEAAPAARSWWLGLPLAASLFGLLLGGAVAYLSVAKLLPGGLEGKQPAVEMAAADNLWLDNAVGYYKLAASAGTAPWSMCRPAVTRARHGKRSAKACLSLRRCDGRTSTSNRGASISAAPGSSLPTAGRRRS